MTTTIPVGPYRTIQVDLGGGQQYSMPFYMMPFDKRGICEWPTTRRHLVDAVGQGTFTDIYCFSHGWNNDWSTATNGYEQFISGFMQMRHELGFPMPAGYRPLLVGIHWPSAALAFTEDERVPKTALESTLESTAEIDNDIGARQQEIQDLAEEMKPELAARFFELVQQQTVDREEASELASLALTVYGEYDDEFGASNNITSDELLDLWADAFSQADDSIEEEQDGSDLDDSQTLEIAISRSSFDPRQIVRVLTVYQMKDRSAKVGKGGVGPLVARPFGHE